MEASVAPNTIIRSIAVTIEEKIALENRVKNISREADYVVDRIDYIAKEIRRCSCSCCRCACTYKKLLEQNVASVNNKYRFTNKLKGIHLHTHKRASDNLYLEVAWEQ